MDEDIDGSSSGRLVDCRFELLYDFGCNAEILTSSEGVLTGDISPSGVAGNGGAIRMRIHCDYLFNPLSACQFTDI